MSYYADEREFYKNMNFLEFKCYVASLEEKGFLNTVNKSGVNLLFFIDNIEQMKYLIDVKKMDCHIFSNNNTTPIFLKNAEVTEYLYHKGLSINQINDDGDSVLCCASFDTTRKLVELGVDFRYGDLTLWENLEKGYEKTRFLLENGYIEKVSEIPETNYINDPDFCDLFIKHGLKITESLIHKDLQYILWLNYENKENKKATDILIKYYMKDEKNKEYVRDFLLSTEAFRENKNNGYNLFLYKKYLCGDLNKELINGIPWFYHIRLYEDTIELLKTYNVDLTRTTKENRNIFHYFDFTDGYDMALKFPEMFYKESQKGQSFFAEKSLEEKKHYILSLLKVSMFSSDLFPLTEDIKKWIEKVIFKELVFNDNLAVERSEIKKNEIFAAPYIEYEKKILESEIKIKKENKILPSRI